jgi:hypothetical protein
VKVLVACEESQAVTKELRRLGHEAYSCDIIECSGGHPEWHIMQDVLPLLNGNCSFQTMDGVQHCIECKWDMIIAFPPCTHLCSSGQHWFTRGVKDISLREEAACFFMMFANADCSKIAIENPVGIMSTRYRKPDQIVQPWMFGDNATKTTCLWLKGLQKLIPNVTKKPDIEYVNYGKHGKRMQKWMYDIRCKTVKDGKRANLASKTFPGIARSMAECWAGVADEGGKS